MITRLKLKPGQKGTKALVKEYGDALICVRYRYDETTRTRLKTVEIIIERKELPAPRQTSVDQRQTVADDALIPVHIAYDAKEQRKLARALDGKWDPDVKLWYIRYGNVKGTELEQHIILDAPQKRGGS